MVRVRPPPYSRSSNVQPRYPGGERPGQGVGQDLDRLRVLLGNPDFEPEPHESPPVGPGAASGAGRSAVWVQVPWSDVADEPWG